MLIDDVCKYFDFLFELGFVVKDSKKQHEWTLILTSDDILLRITHDRSDWFIDVGYSFLPDKWYELWEILNFLNKKNILRQEVRATNKLKGIRNTLKTSIDAIMQVEKYKSELAILKIIGEDNSECSFSEL